MFQSFLYKLKEFTDDLHLNENLQKVTTGFIEKSPKKL